MNVLVTGGAGYIGSFIVRTLRGKGHRVVVIDDLREGHRAAVGEAELIVADFADPAALDRAASSGPLDAVVHMAASAQVGESMRDPAGYYQNNLVRSLALLGLLRARGIDRMVFSSTAAVYGDPVRTPIPEDHPTTPTNPYGETKLAFEKALAWHAVAHGFRSISLRYFNAAGGGIPAGSLGEDHEPETHLVPNVLRAAEGLVPHIEIFGTDWPTPDGTCVRDYVHVIDLAEAHVLALEELERLRPPDACRAYNLGADRAASVLEVITLAEEVTGRKVPVRRGPRRPGDPAVLLASSAKIKRELGWDPRHSDLRTILETAHAWHRSRPRGWGDRS